MGWFRMESTVRDHPKIGRLARRLGVDRIVSVGHVTVLWAWVVDNAPDGNLSAFDAEDIAEVGQWSGDPEVFYQALIDARLLDVSDGQILVHEWLERAESYKAAKRKAAQRSRQSQDNHETITPDRTGQDRTGHKEESAKKKTKKKPEPPTEALELADYLRDRIAEEDPDVKEIQPANWPKTRERWANDLRLAHSRDGRSWANLRIIAKYAHDSEFWRANIRSGAKLREKFETLKAQARREIPEQRNIGPWDTLLSRLKRLGRRELAQQLTDTERIGLKAIGGLSVLADAGPKALPKLRADFLEAIRGAA